MFALLSMSANGIAIAIAIAIAIVIAIKDCVVSIVVERS